MMSVSLVYRLLLVLGLTSALTIVDNKNGTVLMQMVFHEIKPYMFWDEEKSDWNGIFPLIFKKGTSYCTNQDNAIAEFTVHIKSRDEMIEAMRSPTQNGEGVLSNITKKTVGWFPYDVNFLKVGPNFLERNLTLLNLLASNKMVVILPREQIELPNKLLNGFASSTLIIIISVVLAIAFGMLVYIIERPYNPVFQDNRGLLTSLYWSFVTMTTVGYGDVVPVTLLGKAISVVWMFFGLMVAAVYTATLTNSVTGISDLKIKGQRVAVLKDSHEEYFVKRDYLAEPVLFGTYEEAVAAVRAYEVHSAVLPYDIAGWMQDEIRADTSGTPLSMVYLLDGQIPFNFLYSAEDPVFARLFECMFSSYKYEIIDVSEQLYKRPVILEQTVYFDNPFEVFTRNSYVMITSGVTLFLLVIAFVIAVVWRDTRVHVKQRKKKAIEDSILNLSSLLTDYRELEKKEAFEMT